MAYQTWPTALQNPDKPLALTGGTPIFNGESDAIGHVNSIRVKTRPTLVGNTTLFLEADEVQTFLTFWRTTLNRGKRKFRADWIADVGYEGYVAKLISIRLSPRDCACTARLQLELIPDVLLDGSNIPSPWPEPV